jgi:hypothetical protein
MGIITIAVETTLTEALGIDTNNNPIKYEINTMNLMQFENIAGRKLLVKLPKQNRKQKS